jgi:hypothetical protein
MLPLLIGGAALAQGALGFFRAKQQQAEAKRQAAINNSLAANDTEFGAFKNSLDRGHKVGAVSDSGPSAVGAALSGALSGAQQGANIYDVLSGGGGGNKEDPREVADYMNNLKAGGTAPNRIVGDSNIYNEMLLKQLGDRQNG